MATRETPMLRRAVVYVAAECEAYQPGSSSALLINYQQFLNSDVPEAEIICALLGLVVAFTDELECAKTLSSVLAKMKR